MARLDAIRPAGRPGRKQQVGDMRLTIRDLRQRLSGQSTEDRLIDVDDRQGLVKLEFRVRRLPNAVDAHQD